MKTQHVQLRDRTWDKVFVASRKRISLETSDMMWLGVSDNIRNILLWEVTGKTEEQLIEERE